MKLAVTSWMERVAPVMDVACRAVIYSLPETGDTDAPDFSNPDGTKLLLPRGTCFRKIDALIDEGVQVLICGAISQHLRVYSVQRGLAVHPFIAGALSEVVEAFHANTLDNRQFSMPGCRNSICGKGFGKGFGNPNSPRNRGDI